VAVWSAVEGTGPFATETVVQKMITLQVFNVCVALTSFVLASFVTTRERQEEVTRLYAAAYAANEAKSEFLNMAAHELRTPITVLTGYLSLLADGAMGRVPNAWARPLGVLAAKTGELDTIVDGLLQASRVEVAPTPTVREVVDFSKAAGDAVDRARLRADLLHAEISTEVPDDPVLVTGDPVQLGRILDNLINNALSYTARPARVVIRVSTDHERVVVRVEDNGVGIAGDQREKVFDRFYRSASPTGAMVPGVGLGLFISRQLAELHHGSLVVESSKPGEGTVFALVLPLSLADQGPLSS
jgi:signal transduction histidine kinase